MRQDHSDYYWVEQVATHRYYSAVAHGTFPCLSHTAMYTCVCVVYMCVLCIPCIVCEY